MFSCALLIDFLLPTVPESFGIPLNSGRASEVRDDPDNVVAVFILLSPSKYTGH